MHPSALGRAFSLVVVTLIQVIAIIDFNVNNDPKSDAQVCCMIVHTFPQEPFHQCYEQHKTTSMDNETVMCIHQCYYEAIGMFSHGDKVHSDKYIKYKKSLDAVHQESFTFALTVCARIMPKLIKHFEAIEKKPRCSPIPYLFNRCLMEVDIANCPSDRWMNSTLCDLFMTKMKEKYGKGIQRRMT